MPRGLDSSLGRLLRAMRGCRLPPEVCSTRTGRKDWNSAGGGREVLCEEGRTKPLHRRLPLLLEQRQKVCEQVTGFPCILGER